jgi:hypothetical protein
LRLAGFSLAEPGFTEENKSIRGEKPMKAAVLRGAGEIRTENVPDPVLESHGIIIKVEACGICGSDLHVYKQSGKEGTLFGRFAESQD